MSAKQLKAKYSGSFLGLWWAIAIPVIFALSINFVFARVFKVAFKDFTLFVLSGMIPWFFFSNGLLESTNSFLSHSNELRQNIFPRELVPLSCVFANFLNFLIGLVCLLPLFFVVAPGLFLSLPFLVLLLGIFLLFVAGLGLFFSTLNVFFRDLAHFLSVGMMVWFWVTPVFYSLSMLDQKWRGICYLNPLTVFIISFQRVLFEGARPSFASLGACFFMSVFFFIAGYGFFLRKESELLKRI